MTFDSAEGSEVVAQKVAEGNQATKPADPTGEGYAFCGWYDDMGQDDPCIGPAIGYRIPPGDRWVFGPSGI